MKVKLSGKRTLVLLALLGGVLVLYVLGEDQRRENGRDGDGGGSPASNTTQCRIEATTDEVNMRSAPAEVDGNEVGVLNQGDQRDAVKEVENGFRKLADGNWVSVNFVKPLEGRDC